MRYFEKAARVVALWAKGLSGVPVMAWLRQRPLRQRCRLPMVIWALDAVSADAERLSCTAPNSCNNRTWHHLNHYRHRGTIAHHGYEYGDCALLICILPSNAAVMAKSAMIGMRIIVSLPVVVLACLSYYYPIR